MLRVFTVTIAAQTLLSGLLAGLFSPAQAGRLGDVIELAGLNFVEGLPSSLELLFDSDGFFGRLLVGVLRSACELEVWACRDALVAVRIKSNPNDLSCACS
jgi:hypothetical protein